MKVGKMKADSAESEQPFSAREFRKSLWNDAQVIPAMDKFVKLSRDRRHEDVVLEFLKEFASSDATDLTRLLGEKLPLPQVLVVFNCLEAILLRISDGQQNQYGQWSEVIVGQLLQHSPIHNLKRGLAPTNLASVIVSALRLLTTMVTACPSSARTIWASVKINSDHMRALLERSTRSVLLGESVRSATIVYLMAFLMTDDNSLIRQFVDDNGALNAIFPSMFADNAPTIQIFLNTLLSKVVKNSSISKTSKIRLFNLKNLKTILRLFQWKRIRRLQTKSKKHSLSQAEAEAIGASAEDFTEDDISVRQTAFHLLEFVCCSADQGILFTDRKYGMTGDNKNVEITKFLLTQDMPLGNPLIVDLFVSIVKASPDQLVHYLPKLQKNLAVRSTDAWIKTMSYVRRIFEAQQPMEVLRLAEQRSECTKLVQVALMVTTTSMLNKDQLNKILAHEELAVRHHGLLFLSTILENARCLLDSENPDFRTFFSKDDDIRTFVKLFTVELMKKLPAWHRLVNCWDSAFSSRPNAAQNISHAEHVESIVNAISGYIGVNQVFSRDQQLDFILRNLLGNFQTLEEKLSDHDRVVKIQLTTLRLLSDSKLDRHISEEKICKRSVVLIVCDIASRPDLDESVRVASSILLRNLLLATELFRGTEHEIDIWINGLQVSIKPEITEFLSGAIDDLIRDFDILLDERKRRQFETTRSKDVDKVLNEEDFQPEVTDDEFGFSPMVLAVLRMLESSSPRCQKSVSSLLIDVLHCQHDPRLLCQFLVQYGHVLTKKHFKYVRSFDPMFVGGTGTSEKWTLILQKKDLKSLVKEAFESRAAFAIPDAILSDMVQDINSHTDKVRLLTRQLLVYLQVLVSSSSFQLIEFFCDILKSLVKSSENKPEVSSLILSHPVMKRCFLHEDLLAKCPALTKLALFTLDCISPVSDLHAFYLDKALHFITKMLHLIKDGKSKRVKMVLVEILEPFEKHLKGSNLKDLISILSNQFTPTDLTAAGLQVELLLVRIVRIVADRRDQILTADFVRSLAEYHKGIICRPAVEGSDFVREFLRLLESAPMYALAVDEEFFLFCLECISSPVNIEIAEVLMRHNVSNITSFAEWLRSECGWRERPELYVRVIGRYLKHCRSQNDGHRSYDVPLFRMLSKTYWTLLMDAMLENDELAADAVQSLVELDTISTKKKVKFCRRVAESAETGTVLSVGSLDVFRSVLSSLTKIDLEDVSITVLFIKVCLRMMLTSQNVGNVNSDLLEMVSKTLRCDQKQLAGLSRCLQETKLQKSLIKTCLKIGLKDAEGILSLRCLRSLLECLHSNGELDGSQSSLVFEMVFGHSNFLNAVVTSTSSEASTWKTTVLDLLVFLVKMNPSVCKAVHVPVLLAAYEGYLRPVDERLLRLLYLYDSNGVDMHSYKPFVWGRSAVHHYSVLKHLGNSLWKQPRMEEILGLLDKDAMLRTALNFPLDVDLQVEKYVSDGEEQVPSRRNLIYDPRFLLPLFSHLLAPEALVHCTKFIDCNALAVVFASLTSYDESTRSAGCYILNNFRNHLEGHRARNSLIWIYLLDLLRNALPQDDSSATKPVPPLMAAFLTRTCHLLQFPTSAVAQPVINYLFVRSYLDLETAPEFYVLFSNSDVKHNIIRYWILGVLTDGLRTHADFKLCQKRLVFKIILGFFESPLSSPLCKCNILQVLNSANSIPSVAIHLINRQGILAFLVSALRDFGNNTDILTEIVGVVSSAWKSVRSDVSSTMRTQFLLVLVSILDCVNASTSLTTFLDFLRTMSSVLAPWTIDDARQIISGLTTSLIKKLLDAYVSMIKIGQIQATIDEAQKAASDILLRWRPQSSESLTKKELSVYESVFVSSLEFLLKTFPACPENYERLLRIYSSITSHLRQDASGMLAKRVSMSSEDVTSCVYKAYEHLMMAAGDYKVESEFGPADVLVNLNMLIVTMAHVWIPMPISETDYYSEHPFPKLLIRVQQISSDPEIVNVISSLNSVCARQRRFAAVAFGLLVCELWIHKNDSRHFWKFLKSAPDVFFTTKETQDLFSEITTRKRTTQDSVNSIDLSVVKRYRRS